MIFAAFKAQHLVVFYSGQNFSGTVILSARRKRNFTTLQLK
jgi:hypothetical protein